jgi:hypothetical protein
MTASGSTPPSGESLTDVSEYERVGRFLLAQRISESRENLLDQLNALEHQAHEGNPIHPGHVQALLGAINELEELVTLLQMAGTEAAQEVETDPMEGEGPIR